MRDLKNIVEQAEAISLSSPDSVRECVRLCAFLQTKMHEQENFGSELRKQRVQTLRLRVHYLLQSK